MRRSVVMLNDGSEVVLPALGGVFLPAATGVGGVRLPLLPAVGGVLARGRDVGGVLHPEALPLGGVLSPEVLGRLTTGAPGRVTRAGLTFRWATMGDFGAALALLVGASRVFAGRPR